jgi:hypothetical protein
MDIAGIPIVITQFPYSLYKSVKILHEIVIIIILLAKTISTKYSKINLISSTKEGVVPLKRFTSLLFTGLVSLILAGCGDSDNKELTLNSKHKELPDYVLGTSDLIKETYIMAAEYPKVLASVPCYCGCYGEDGHISNLDCFVDQMGSNNEVIEWDAMSVS